MRFCLISSIPHFLRENKIPKSAISLLLLLISKAQSKRIRSAFSVLNESTFMYLRFLQAICHITKSLAIEVLPASRNATHQASLILPSTKSSQS